MLRAKSSATSFPTPRSCSPRPLATQTSLVAGQLNLRVRATGHVCVCKIRFLWLLASEDERVRHSPNNPNNPNKTIGSVEASTVILWNGCGCTCQCMRISSFLHAQTRSAQFARTRPPPARYPHLRLRACVDVGRARGCCRLLSICVWCVWCVRVYACVEINTRTSARQIPCCGLRDSNTACGVMRDANTVLRVQALARQRLVAEVRERVIK
jgi:hypothetical protein